MSRLRFGASALLLMLVAAHSAHAASTADLQQCRGIADDSSRLSCYDALVPAAPIEPAPPVAPAAAAAASRSGADDFGAETVRRKPSTEDRPQEQALHASVVGHVESARKGVRLKLDNSQIWQVTDDRDVLLDLDNPAVTIERNFIGSYFLTIDGRTTRLRVRRVQ